MARLSRRRYLGGLVGATALSGCASGGSSTAAPTVETIEIGDQTGGPIAVRPAGEPALVDFFATWCPPCKPQMAELRSITQQFPDLHVLSVTRQDDEDAIRQFWTEYDGTWPVGTDPSLTVFQQYDVTSVPTKVLLDDGGQIQWRHTGLATAGTIADAIRELER